MTVSLLPGLENLTAISVPRGSVTWSFARPATPIFRDARLGDRAQDASHAHQICVLDS